MSKASSQHPQTVEWDPTAKLWMKELPEGLLRALGAVLGDLATLGFDAEWEMRAASDDGATHRRRRVIVNAWPTVADTDTDTDGDEPERPGVAGVLGGQTTTEPGEADQRERAGDTARHGGETAAHTSHLGHERRRDARGGRPGPAHRDLTAADTNGRRREGNTERHRAAQDEQLEREPGMDAVRRGVRREIVEPDCPTCGCPESQHDAGGLCDGCLRCADPQLGQPGFDCGDDCEVCTAEAASDAESQGRQGEELEPAWRGPERGRAPVAADADHDRTGEEHPSTDLVHRERQAKRRGTVQLTGSDGDRETRDGGTTGEPSAERGSTAVQPGSGEQAPPDPPSVGWGEGRPESARLEGRPDAAVGGHADVDWGGYEPAIRRWEAVLGRRAPRPVDDLGRLSPAFTEWMMGLPAGWVTDTPGLPRNAQLKALGNGVVRLQAAAANLLLRDRIPVEARLPLAAPQLDVAA